MYVTDPQAKSLLSAGNFEGLATYYSKSNNPLEQGRFFYLTKRPEQSVLLYERTNDFQSLELNYDWLQVLRLLGRHEDALKVAEKFVISHPKHPEAIFRYKALQLLLGQIEIWQNYNVYDNQTIDQRCILPTTAIELAGKKVLIKMQWGLGDNLQWLRYIEPVAQLGANVTVWCPAAETVAYPELAELYRRLLDGINITTKQPPYDAFDYLIGAGGLPFFFRSTKANMPHNKPCRRLTNHEATHKKLRIGLVWQGDREKLYNFNCSIRLKSLTPLFRHFRDTVEFVPLQNSFYLNDLGILDQYQIRDHGLDTFVKTAGLIQQMDLVISVDTAVAHLAGVLNKPIWLLLAPNHDCRWYLNGAESPWYPSMKIWRQGQPRSWDPIIEKLIGAIEHELTTSDV